MTISSSAGRMTAPMRPYRDRSRGRDEEPTGIYPCPCCGYLTFPAPKGGGHSLHLSGVLLGKRRIRPGEDDPSDENRGLTLRQGRENYRRWGAVRPDLVVHARPPRPEERPKEMPASRLTAPPGTGTAREGESPRSRPSVKAWQAWKEAKISMLSVRWKSRSWSA